MVRQLRSLLVAVMIAGLSGSLHAQILFTASLNGSQETPPVVTAGQGTLWAVLNPDMSSLTFRLTFAQLSAPASAMHFHVAVPGVGGPVVFPITFSGNTASGTWSNIPDTILQHLIKGEVYANVHSSNHPGGEIRGQLVLAPGMGFTISADGTQETPATGSGGTGTGYAYIDSLGKTLTYAITIAGLSDTVTGSHFHSGLARRPRPGRPCRSPLPTARRPVDGLGFADSIYGQLARSELYFNIHTKAHPGGEIRGQLVSVTGQRFTVSLDGTQETPANAAPGQGTAWAILSPDGSSILYRATFAELTGPVTGSHFHAGPSGVVGSVVHPFSENGNTASGQWTSPADSIIRNLLMGDMYMNFHTSAHPGGEIRGQLMPASAVEFIMGLNASQESGVSSPGTGTGYGLLDSLGRKLIVSGDRCSTERLADRGTFPSGSCRRQWIRLLSPCRSRTAHQAVSGPAIRTGTSRAFMQGLYYFNVHTKAHPGARSAGRWCLNPRS